MRAATYVRLSASGLGTEAPGLERQREATERLVRERGWELAGAFQDADVSAWSGAPRPGFAELRAVVEAGKADAVVVWKLDRAFRSLSEAVGFLTLCRERGVAFVSATEGIDTSSQFGPVLFALFAAMAEIESTTRSDRSRAFHQQRAEQGKPSGGGDRPYGFDEDRITHRPQEAALIREAAADLLAGGSLRMWAEQFGLTTTSARRLLTSPRVAGLRQHGSETYPAAWEPVLDEETWLKVCSLFEGRHRQAYGRRYLLAGIAVCGLCGVRLTALPKADGRRCYTCRRDGGGCGRIRRLAAPLEEYVATQVSGHFDLRARHEDRPRRADAAAQLRAQLRADEDALDELARARFVTRSLSEREFRSARDPLADRIVASQEALTRVTAGGGRLRIDLDEVDTAPWEVPDGTDPDQDELAEWRAWVGEVVEQVVVKPAVRGHNFFDPSCVEIVWREGVA